MHALPPILFGGIRFMCAGVLLGLTALALGQRFELDATEWRHMFIVAVGNVLIANGCTNWAMQYVASNQTAILNASAALWIALLATRGPARARARPAHADRARHRLRRRDAHHLAARQPARPATSACSC